MIKNMRLSYSVPLLCKLFHVSASGFYVWFKRKPCKHKREEARLKVEILAAHKRTRKTYGAERLQKDLLAHGVKVGVSRVKRIRRELNIYCKQKKKFKATTDSCHSFPIADNLLEQRFEADCPNSIWLSDITYIPTGEGFLYLACHKDVFSGEIVGYAMSSRMKLDLIKQSLLRAVNLKHTAVGLIHHSDRGSQYCSLDYAELLKQFGIIKSMSRKGNCFDNAPMESFCGILKNELVYRTCYKTRQDAIRNITEYIEIFYNRQRLQKKLGFLSPFDYGQQFYKKQLAA